MNKRYYDFDAMDCDVNYRFLQPPQIAYFVTTVDDNGNENVTPVTLGTLVAAQGPRGEKPSEYYFTFAMGCQNLLDERNAVEARQGYHNLMKHKECVISYIGHDLMYESTISGLPIPKGISEIDVSGLTKLESKKVVPCGIQECAINMEAKVISTTQLGTYYHLFVCQIVGISVDEKMVQEDDGFGVYHIDPLFEVHIGQDAGQTEQDNRLYYGRMDKAKIHRTDYGIGCIGDWVGTFEHWMDSEVKRGRIDELEREEIMDLNERWQHNRDPETNGDVKLALTKKLKAICQRNG